MSRLQIELPDSVAEEIERLAEERGQTVPEYVREVLENQAADQWPSNFFDRVAGGWKGEELSRSAQGDFEERERL